MTSQFGMRQFCLLSLLIFALAATSHLSAQSQSCQASGKICVLTWQQDTSSEVCSGCAYRTGENLSESTITSSTIQNDNFGQLCSYGVDGQVYGQPLVVTNVTIPIPQGTDDIAYVVTMNNTVYAFNATPGTTGGGATCPLLMHQSISAYLPQGQQTAVSCHKIGGKDCLAIAQSVGILSTPVIQPSGTGGTMYLVTYTQDSTGTNFYHYLHALDITTLQEKTNSPVLICPTGQSCPDAFSFKHIQRPGLLLANCGSAPPCNGKTYVYVAFSMMDGYPFPFPNGAIFGYDAENLNGDTNFFYLQTSVGELSNTSNGGGIWMGGSAPAFGPDVNGKNWIYLNTANGSFTLNVNGGTDAGDSFLKIDPNQLVIQNDGHGNNLGYLAPVDQYFRSSWTQQQGGGYKPTCQNQGSNGDIDFGSGGVMLIPDSELTNWPRLAVGGDKEGGLWFIKRDSPGQYQTTCDGTHYPYTPCSCQVTGSNPSGNVQTFWTGSSYAGNTIRGGMAYWEYDDILPEENYAYAAQYTGPLVQYTLCGKASASYPIDQTACSGPPISATFGGQVVDFPAGATPAVSASAPGASDAIVWVIGGQTQNQTPWPTQGGVLYAFDAVSMQGLYSNNNPCLPDAMNPSTKMSVPTVANGYVYLGTESANTNQQNQNQGTFYIFGPGRTSGGTGC